MSLKLVRVDDRLIHGQVIVGWVQALGVDRIVVVDDDVADNAWQQELYTLGTPPSLKLDFVSVTDAPALMARVVESKDTTIVLLGTVATAVRLCATVESIDALNLGGIHDGSGRTKRLPYLYISDEEADALKALAGRGVKITARDVPTARSVPLEELL